MAFWHNRKKLSARAREIAAGMDLQFADFDEKVEKLSSSDRQMIAIARSLAAKPKLLILDEPTASLSEREAKRCSTLPGPARTGRIHVLCLASAS